MTSPRNVIIQGHALDILRGLPDGSVQTIVTSPPYYGLRAYDTEPQVWGGASGSVWRGELGQEPTPAFFVEHLVTIFRECRRVLRKDGLCFVNLGDSYAGNGHLGKQGQTGQRASRTFTATGAKPKVDYPSKSLMNIPHRFAIAMGDDGWIHRSSIIWHKPNAMPESVTDRPSQSHEYIFMFAKHSRYFYDATAIAEPATGHGQGTLGVHMGQKLHVDEKIGQTHIHHGHGRTTLKSTEFSTRNARSVWSIPTSPYAAAHFATFPAELAEKMILAGSSPYACDVCGAAYEQQLERTKMVTKAGPKRGMYGSRTTDGFSGTMVAPAHCVTTGWKATCKHTTDGDGRCVILDPFSGAGTVALVAKRLGRDYLGCELNPAYVAMSEERLLRDTLPTAMKHTALELIPTPLFGEDAS